MTTQVVNVAITTTSTVRVTKTAGRHLALVTLSVVMAIWAFTGRFARPFKGGSSTATIVGRPNFTD